MKLSVIVPVYNEESTVAGLLSAVRAATSGFDREIIAVDDGSTDGTARMLAKQAGIKAVRHAENQGKGAAVRTGLEHSSGDIIIIQDADMEYDPRDMMRCVMPIAQGGAKAVYGSRRLRPNEKGIFAFFIGNSLLTGIANMLYGSKLTDMFTCYKALDSRLMKSLRIESRGFEIEAEITAKLLRRGVSIVEVPIGYMPRRKGKKIRYRDGLRSLWALVRYRV